MCIFKLAYLSLDICNGEESHREKRQLAQQVASLRYALKADASVTRAPDDGMLFRDDDRLSLAIAGHIQLCVKTDQLYMNVYMLFSLV